MALIDTTMLLVLCYVFGILTAAILYVLVVSPVERNRKRRDYQIGFMDGLHYAEHGGEEI
jgi:hypothetical protein